MAAPSSRTAASNLVAASNICAGAAASRCLGPMIANIQVMDWTARMRARGCAHALAWTLVSLCALACSNDEQRVGAERDAKDKAAPLATPSLPAAPRVAEPPSTSVAPAAQPLTAPKPHEPDPSKPEPPKPLLRLAEYSSGRHHSSKYSIELFRDGRYLEQESGGNVALRCEAQLPESAVRPYAQHSFSEQLRRAGRALPRMQPPAGGSSVSSSIEIYGTESAAWMGPLDELGDAADRRPLPAFLRSLVRRITGLVSNPAAASDETRRIFGGLASAFSHCKARNQSAMVTFSVEPSTGAPFDIDVYRAEGDARACLERVVWKTRFATVPAGKPFCTPRFGVGAERWAAARPARGVLTLEASEPADVLLDNRVLGQTPYAVTLEPRLYRFEVRSIARSLMRRLDVHLAPAERRTELVTFEPKR